MSLPCFDTLHEPSSWTYHHLVVRIISELMGHSTDPPCVGEWWPPDFSLDRFSQSQALVALDCSATALRKGRCTSALNTAANVMASPTTFLGISSRCFKSEATKQLSSTYSLESAVEEKSWQWYSWKWLVVFKLCWKFWILRLEVVSTNTIFAAYDINRYSFMQTVPLSPYICLEVHQFQQASHAFSAGSLLHLWCFCRWLCSWRGCWSCVVAATIGGSRSSTDSRATTGHTGTLWIAGSGCQSGHWLWHWRKRLNVWWLHKRPRLSTTSQGWRKDINKMKL